MASKRNGTLYTGVTSNLPRRVWQHREGAGGFSERHDCRLLVWFEMHGTMELAIVREKQIKAGSRAKKLKLIETERSEEHTSELQSLMRISYAVLCLKKKTTRSMHYFCFKAIITHYNSP